jgi:small subunit ribosomal protein S6
VSLASRVPGGGSYSQPPFHMASEREYELILMLDPEAPDERRDQIAEEARRRIESAGTLKHGDSWGMRKLAYEIRQRTEADYRFYRFQSESGLLDDLDHNLKITDGVLRFRIFKVDPGAPVITPPEPQAVAARGRRDGRGDRRGGGPPRRGAETEERPEPAPAAPSAPEAAEQAPAAPEAADEAPAAPEPADEAPAAAEAAEEAPAAAEQPQAESEQRQPDEAEQPQPAEEQA